LNGEPITEERFWQIENEQMRTGKVGRVTITAGGKRLGNPITVLDDKDA
jgi:hypothetical protein